MNINENLLSLRDCAKLLGLNYDTIRLYVNQGIAVGPRVVKLSAVRVGKRTYRTSKQALEQFVAALNPERKSTASAKERKADDDHIKHVLARHGI